MEIANLENLWNEFANISINENDCTEVAFHIWKARTKRVLVWEWFNKNLSYGLEYMSMSLIQLEALWDDFSNIPINDDEIEDDFYCWEKRTYRFDVWYKQELLEERIQLMERLQAREKLAATETELSRNIYERGVDYKGFANIRSKGYWALFGGHNTRFSFQIFKSFREVSILSFVSSLLKVCATNFSPISFS